MKPVKPLPQFIEMLLSILVKFDERDPYNMDNLIMKI